MIFRTATHPVPDSPGSLLQRRWIKSAAEQAAATAHEHAELVATVQATEGLTRQQAEEQVTSFETYFRDDPN